MGIPQLAQLLQPYAVSTVIGCKNPGCGRHKLQQGTSGPQIIIDGPGLAYHVYHKILAHKPRTLNAVDAIPTYTEIGNAAITFLDELGSYGLQIDHIYFDGYLPIYKRDTRLQRLKSSRKDLVAFQKKNTTGFTISDQSARDCRVTATATQLLSNASTPLSPYRGTPTSPFLVASVIEDLLQSHYASATSVVGWEADALCADAARRASPGAIVLMNDSDYLVHDLGYHSSSGFIDQLEIKVRKADGKCPHTCHTLEISTFQNRSIAERLGLRDTKRLAYEVKLQPSITLKDAVRRTLLSPSDATQFREFLAEYDMPWEEIFGSQASPTLSHPLLRENTLDPRISELVLQVRYHTAVQAVNMYLPVLLEDPRRASAWNDHVDDRLFAYSCLHQYSYVTAKRESIWEFFRKGDRVTSEAMQLLDEEQIQVHATKLLASVRGCSGYYTWRQYALSKIRTPDMTKEDSADMLIGNAKAHNWSWKDIHNYARMEAVLYSLRIVQQVFQIMVKMLVDLPQTILEIEQSLATLPPLKVMMASRLEVLQRGEYYHQHSVSEYKKSFCSVMWSSFSNSKWNK